MVSYSLYVLFFPDPFSLPTLTPQTINNNEWKVYIYNSLFLSQTKRTVNRDKKVK